MKKIIACLFLLFPLILLAQNETFDLKHSISIKKTELKNTAHIEGIRFFDLNDTRTIFINGNFDGVYGRNFYTSWGAGLRNYFSQFGLGVNAYWDFSNETKFAINQIGFGVEVIFEKFSFFYNRSIPLTKDRSKLLYKVYFSNSSQIGLKHSLRPTLYYAISANFREDSARIGGKLEVSKQFKYGFTLGALVTYDGSTTPVVGMCFGYRFGGEKPSKYQKPIRSQKIQYRIIRAKIKQVQDKIIVTPPQDPQQTDPEKKNTLFDWLFR